VSYARLPLSGSTDGRGIKVAAVATPGTTIHTAQASGTFVDVVTLYAYNSDIVDHRLTLEWGGTTAPDDNLVFDLPSKATVPIVVDLTIRNSLVVKAFADLTNVVVIFGFINRGS